MPSMLTNLGCAGSAAVITVTGIHPIDTVKTRLQVSGTKGARNYAALGISGTVSTILKEEGARGLWAGTVPALFLWVPYTAIQFAALGEFRRRAERAGADPKAPQLARTGTSHGPHSLWQPP